MHEDAELSDPKPFARPAGDALCSGKPSAVKDGVLNRH